MSTKAIREMLALVADGQSVPRRVRYAVEADLLAIENACRDWYAQETRRGVVLASDALAPFERIALETKP